MAYQMVTTAVTLNDLKGHSPLVDVFTCNPSNICAAFYTISTDSMLAWFLCTSRAFGHNGKCHWVADGEMFRIRMRKLDNISV